MTEMLPRSVLPKSAVTISVYMCNMVLSMTARTASVNSAMIASIAGLVGRTGHTSTAYGFLRSLSERKVQTQLILSSFIQ